MARTERYNGTLVRLPLLADFASQQVYASVDPTGASAFGGVGARQFLRCVIEDTTPAKSGWEVVYLVARDGGAVRLLRGQEGTAARAWKAGRCQLRSFPTDAITELSGGGGSAWYTGAGAPDNGVGVEGDFYLRGSNGHVYEKGASTWADTGTVLKGADGAPGVDGAPGAPGDIVYNAPDGGTENFIQKPNVAGELVDTEHSEIDTPELGIATESGKVQRFAGHRLWLGDELPLTSKLGYHDFIPEDFQAYDSLNNVYNIWTMLHFGLGSDRPNTKLCNSVFLAFDQSFAPDVGAGEEKSTFGFIVGAPRLGGTSHWTQAHTPNDYDGNYPFDIMNGVGMIGWSPLIDNDGRLDYYSAIRLRERVECGGDVTRFEQVHAHPLIAPLGYFSSYSGIYLGPEITPGTTANQMYGFSFGGYMVPGTTWVTPYSGAAAFEDYGYLDLAPDDSRADFYYSFASYTFGAAAHNVYGLYIEEGFADGLGDGEAFGIKLVDSDAFFGGEVIFANEPTLLNQTDAGGGANIGSLAATVFKTVTLLVDYGAGPVARKFLTIS